MVVQRVTVDIHQVEGLTVVRSQDEVDRAHVLPVSLNGRWWYRKPRLLSSTVDLTRTHAPLTVLHRGPHEALYTVAICETHSAARVRSVCGAMISAAGP